MVNEFHGRAFSCASFVPSGGIYSEVTGLQRVCSAIGSKAGFDYVSGVDYLRTAYEYDNANKWRYVSIAFTVFLDS